MATVHPSRMGLVPQDPKDTYLARRRARSPSPRARSPPRHSERERDSGRNRARDRSRERERDKRRDASKHKDRDGGDVRKRDDDIDPRQSLNPDRGRDRERDRSKERRRGSPEYTDYKRHATPPPTEAPWRNQENLYPNRQGRDRPPHAGGSYGGGGSEYLESRRAQRDASTLSIWPPSPKAPTRTLSPSRVAKSRKSKRDRSLTPTDSSDSEDERRRKERKDRKRARKEKDRAERRERKERKNRAHSRHRSYDSAEEDRERSRRSKSKSYHPRSPSPSRTPSPPRASEEDEWVEKPAAAPFASSSSVDQSLNSMPPPSTIPSHSGEAMDEDSDEDVGPQPLHKVIMKKFDERAYGSALLRGEGSAMAAFLQDDTDSRIPRRGEIGLTSDEIAQFESVGYVMSGSRHKRMNAVRMRKENQVISAEEKRGILKLQKDERQRRETILREEFSELVTEKLKGPQVQPK
ncbi:ras-induced vulval development antagonist-domain-containing protein [Suillus fuscotomentosus]|uniref:Ras-induced vulval development antagonist-domain-containing protein n=1 Tax=Suillus fuscotomentosus TaxID=1912939 RepID=A0AAD4E8X0_9AGAM|nr:ras-induced vulval development antagonist-domain-containing protein [Suillus fuscotomentosus]KAG1900498.1 ras-induced vulval development antagonist-domain-containing protein [Suillus fuscotomentosus]